MTYIVAEPCLDLKDASCVEVCPVDCIYEAERLLVMRPAINYAQSRGTAAVDALVAAYARDDPGDPPPPE